MFHHAYIITECLISVSYVIPLTYFGGGTYWEGQGLHGEADIEINVYIFLLHKWRRFTWIDCMQMIWLLFTYNILDFHLPEKPIFDACVVFCCLSIFFGSVDWFLSEWFFKFNWLTLAWFLEPRKNAIWAWRGWGRCLLRATTIKKSFRACDEFYKLCYA